MRILMLSQWFEPEPISKGLAFATRLRDRGHDVQVLTGFPNYPDGKIYPGYQLKALQRETMQGIPILRVPLYPSHDTNKLHRIANYGSFAASAAVLGTLLTTPADVVYVYHPPATVALPAAFLKLFRRTPMVYDIQDLWPDTLTATGMVNNKNILGAVDLWCRATYRMADRLVVLSEGFRDRVIARGADPSRVHVIYNWCDEDQIRPEEPDPAVAREFGMEGKFNVLFAGTMGKAQGLDAVLDAAAKVRLADPKIQFVFVGGGIDVDRLKARVAAEGLGNIRFIPRQPMSAIGRIMAVADVLLVHLKNDPLFEITIPSKTQAYLAMGRPILMAVPGEAARVVERAGAGISCAPEDPDALATAVLSLARRSANELGAMGQRGKDFYRTTLSMDTGITRFEEVFALAAGLA